MTIKKKYLNYVILFIYLFICTIFFWQIFDITVRYTPYSDVHISDLERYYIFFQEVDFDYFSNLESYFIKKDDGGYILLTILLKKLGVTFGNFIFVLIFLNYLIYLIIFCRISSSKYWIIYLLLFFFASFFLNSYVGSILRQGIAMSVIIYFIIINNKITLIRGLLVTIFASSFHLSAILILPYLILEKIFINRLMNLIIFFIIINCFYILDFTYLFSDFFYNLLILFEINTRSLLANESHHPTVGFSIFKLLATTGPLIIFLLCIDRNFARIIEKRIISFYIYFSSIGMLLSQLTYNDRIFIYGWVLSPIMLAYCCERILKIFIIYFNKKFKKNIK